MDTAHAVYENGEETSSTPISFFAEESLGTVKLFTALPYLFDVLESGGILFIDEIENGLHLSLAKEIIKLFINEETNTSCTAYMYIPSAAFSFGKFPARSGMGYE